MVALAPIAAGWGLVAHQLGHVVAVVAEGGIVLSVGLLHLRWLPASDVDRPLILLAPYLVDLALVASTTLFGHWLFVRGRGAAVGGAVLFFLPVLDVVTGVAALVHGEAGADLTLVLRGFELPTLAMAALWLAVVSEVGLLIVRRVFGADALSGWEYVALWLAVVGLAVGARLALG